VDGLQGVTDPADRAWALLQGARALLQGARRILVLTGAGISAESGVPTFRGEGGLWRSHRPEELATPQAFARDPVLVWAWYQWRRDLVAGCAPNPGHDALARLVLRGRAELVTQNVDGLHELAARRAAGDADPSPALPLALHGSLFGNRCTRCGRRSDGRGTPVDATSVDTLPRCPEPCGGLLRPDVVWFGEGLDPRLLYRAFSLAEAADVCLAVGTSAAVQPAASIPLATLRAGGSLVEVNPEPSPLSPYAAASLQGPAGELLPHLLGKA
jgi:NAD-dependent deacetylase